MIKCFIPSLLETLEESQNLQINAGAEEFVTRTQGASDLELESLGHARFTNPLPLYIKLYLLKPIVYPMVIPWLSHDERNPMVIP